MLCRVNEMAKLGLMFYSIIEYQNRLELRIRIGKFGTEHVHFTQLFKKLITYTNDNFSGEFSREPEAYDHVMKKIPKIKIKPDLVKLKVLKSIIILF